MKDLKQEGISNVFSEASRRTIKEMGKIEFFELGETVSFVHTRFQRRDSLLIVW